jgi:hypothetical protein
MNLASRAQRVSHLPRRADAETPPLRVSQTVNHNSPHTTAFLSRVSAVLYERLRGICAISILHPCVSSVSCLCMVSHVSGVILNPITQYPESSPHMYARSRQQCTGNRETGLNFIIQASDLQIHEACLLTPSASVLLTLSDRYNSEMSLRAASRRPSHGQATTPNTFPRQD